MLSARLKRIRKSLGLSQREMARKIGITGTAWQHYENGLNVPGGNVLIELGKLGISLNWLLLGTDEMVRDPKPTQSEKSSTRSHILRNRNAMMKELGLDELIAMASGSHIADEYTVHTVLSQRYPEGCSLEEIEKVLEQRGHEFGRQDIDLLLRLLIARRVARKDESDPPRFYSVGPNTEMVAKDITGHAQLIVRSISTLVHEVLPRASLPEGSIINTRVTTTPGEGARLIERLKLVLKQECNNFLQDGPEEQVVLVVGMARVEEKQLKSSADSV